MANKRIGFAVMRGQPPHIGHLDILTRITRECDTAILGLGSTGNDIDESNPWTQVIRTEMFRNVFGDRLVIIPLEDLPKKDKNRSKNDWVDYVLDMCKKYGYENVTDYYSGSKADAVWYAERFYNETMVDPMIESYSDLPPFDDDDNFIAPNGEERLLHIIDREKNDCPSATEIRTLISLGEVKEWKKWIPRVNHDIILSTYPKKFIMR